MSEPKNIFDQILDNKIQEPQGLTVNSVRQNIDPRPDLKSDHFFWNLILNNAEKLCPDLTPRLHAIRCGGGLLEETLHGFKLHPGNEDWTQKEAWDDVKKQQLDPLREKVISLFKISKFGRVDDMSEKEAAAAQRILEGRPEQPVQDAIFQIPGGDDER